MKSAQDDSSRSIARLLFASLFAFALAAPEARAAVAKTDFAKKMTLTPSGTALAKIGETAWADFPVLVRLPAEVSAEFRTADGSDLVVTDENGTSLPFEVEAFDPAGTTFVWVKVPSLSASTELTVWFGGASNVDNDPTAVWSRYVGVWHYAPSEADGKSVADATGHGLTGSTTGELSTYAGPFGCDAIHSTAVVTAPDYDTRVPVASQFTASGWFKLPSWGGGDGNYFYFVSKKVGLNWDNANGWYVQMNQSNTKMGIVLGGSEPFATIPDVSANWNHFCVVSDGTTVKVYMNGASAASISASHVIKASGTTFAISPNKTDNCADEYRIRAGAASAAETALEYATMADATFFEQGAVEYVDPTAQKFQTPTVTRNANGTYTVTVVLSENSGDVGVIYDAGETSITNILATAATPGTYTDTPANLTANTTYKFAAYGKNANGTEIVAKGGVFYNGDISIEKISDANENGLVTGVFRISRADTAHDLTVSYTVGGSATAGQTYEALSGTATIPAGSSSEDVPVQPLRDRQTDANATVVLTLATGLYGVDAVAGGAELTIVNHRFLQPTDFRKKMTFTPSATILETIGESTFADFPVLVRLPAATSALLRPTDGTDLLFTDENDAVLSFEIDTFDPAGETLVWVKVPSLSAATELTAYFVGAANGDNVPADVWSCYAVVVHGGDSLANAVAGGPAVSAGSSSVSANADAGKIGGGVRKSDYKTIGVNAANVASALANTGKFSVSAWFKRSSGSGNNTGTHILAASRPGWNEGSGFVWLNEQNKYIAISAPNTHQWSSGIDKLAEGVWAHVAFAYEKGVSLTSFFNGAQDNRKTSGLGNLENTSGTWTFGSYANKASDDSFKGDMDELRVFDGVASGDWIALEYATMADAAFFGAGQIEDVDVSAPFVGVPVITYAAGVFSVSAEISTNVPASVFCDADGVTNAMTTVDAELPMTYSAAISGLMEDTTYRCSVLAVSTGGSTISETCPTAFYNGDLAVAKISDADETGLVPGSFRISRADSAYDLAVAYTVGGTAVSGRNYAALSGTATIPAGSTFVDIEVTPILDAQTDADTTVVLTLSAGLYGIDAVAGSAELNVINHHFAQSIDFAKKMTLAPSETALAKIGETAWADFPVLVRLPAEVSDQLRSANGTDLFFTDENDAVLSYEVDTYNPAGETLVWVKVPSLSSATELTVYFGGAANVDNDPTAVWTNYAGVWHMNEASGTVADATGNGLGASPAKATAVSIAQTAGAVGTARQTATSDVKDYLTIPNYNSLGVGGNFTFSCFYDATARKGYDRLVSRKETHDAGNGWEVEMANASDKLSARGASATSISGTFSDLVSSGWMRFTFVYSGTTLRAYLNGAQIGTGTITAATDNGKPLSIGCDSDGSEAYFVGYVDEARLRKGAASAAEVALEYATMSDATFFELGAIESVDATAQVFDTPTIVRNANGTYTVTVVLSENSGDVGVIYDAGETAVTNVIQAAASPGTYTDTPANLTAGTTYKFSAYGKNAKGTEAVKKGGVFYNGDISIAKISDANENGLVTGVFRISRADTAHDLMVTYTVGGSATAGQTYGTLSGTATIPAGSSSVDVEVVPLIDAQTTEDKTVALTLNAGLYGIDAQAGSAEMTVVNLAAPIGYNTWVATADGLASVDSNWSAGHSPRAGENVLFDGRFSKANCEWDAAASATVASWTQNADYTGTVEIQTTYASGAFPLFSIAGDCIVSGGKWTHPANSDSEVYRLKVSVGGDFTLAAAATIDVTCKGYAKEKFPSGSGKGVHGGGCGGCGATYGDPFVPERLGSGYNSPGGGAVYLAVAGAATVDGTITTQASKGSTTASEYGAPGSIYLQAASIGGNGYVHANNPDNNRCAGGRIALHATGSEEIGIPVSHMSVQGGYTWVCGGSGTLLLRTKNQEHGVLYIDTPTRTNYYTNGYPTSDETTVIPSGQTWTVDGIDFRNSGILTVGPGTTLALANGFASITGGARTAGILYNGGTITSAQASSETLSGAWTFQANRNYMFTGDVTVKNGASIGGLRLYQVTNYVDRVDYLCDVRVAGNLTVESGGFLSGDFSGYTYKTFAGDGSYQNSERFGDPYAHGGQIFLSENGAYGSILNPAMPGTYGQTDDRNTQNLGGGVLKLVVDGALTINGTVTSVGGTSSSNGQGSGGSINITAGSLSGSGTMSASGCKATSATTAFINMDYMLKHRGVKSASAGGRIAVRLTGSGASFSNHWIENILATGALNLSDGKTVFTNGCASAGTVYLQTAADGEGGGTVYVRNGNQTENPAVTPIPSTRWGGERDDLTKASLAIGAAARVKLFDGLKMKSLEMASGTTLDLNGKTLTVKSAKIGDTKLMPGTYAAGDDAVAGFVVDSVTGGSLVVNGGGLSIVVR